MGFIYAGTAMRKRRMIESPSCAVRVMQQPDLGALGRFTGGPGVTLGDFSPTQLLSSLVPAPTSSFSFNSPWLIGGIALLGLGLLLFYGRKVKRQYTSYARKRAKRTARISALESELALAKAS